MKTCKEEFRLNEMKWDEKVVNKLETILGTCIIVNAIETKNIRKKYERMIITIKIVYHFCTTCAVFCGGDTEFFLKCTNQASRNNEWRAG